MNKFKIGDKVRISRAPTAAECTLAGYYSYGEGRWPGGAADRKRAWMQSRDTLVVSRVISDETVELTHDGAGHGWTFLSCCLTRAVKPTIII